MSWRDRLFGAGLISNIGANGFAMLVQILMPLVSVPVLAHTWGLEYYGVWLIMLTIPAYIGSGELGFQGAGANEMTASVAQGDRQRALEIFQALAAATGLVVLLIGVVGTVLILGPLRHLFNFAQVAAEQNAVPVALAMLAYGLVNLVGGLTHVALRSTGAYSKYTHAIAAATLCEQAAVLIVAFAGGLILPAAIAFLAIRVVVTAALWTVAARHCGWLLDPRWQSSLRYLRPMAKPAFALAVLPLSLTFSIQSMAVVIAAAGAVSLVPVFTAVRTLTRFGVQLTTVVSTAVMPLFTASSAVKDEHRSGDLVAVTLSASMVVLIPAFFGLLILGPWFISVWTSDAIVPPYALIAALAGAMLFNGTWMPLSNLIIALNQQHRFTYAFLVASAAMLGLAYVLTEAIGLAGAGLATLALDFAMLIWVVIQARRLGILKHGAVRHAPQRALQLVRAAARL